MFDCNKIENENNFTVIKLDEDNEDNIDNEYNKEQKSIEDEINEGIERLKKQSWKYYFYTLFCCK